MRGRGDIQILDGSSREPGELVWMVRGAERTFDDAEPSARPWLEESVDWNAPFRPEPTRTVEKPPDDGLTWV